MRILAIDPGPESSAYVMWNNGRLEYMSHVTNRTLLGSIRGGSFGVYWLAVETIQCYGMPVGAESFMTMFWAGRFCEAAQMDERSLVKRSEIKLHICGNPRAKDPNVRQALIDRFGKPGTKKNPGALYGVSNHIWSALAIAVFTHDTKAKTICLSLPPHRISNQVARF